MAISQGNKIILVGGSGFLGRHVVQSLIPSSRNRIVLASRRPETTYRELQHLGRQLLPSLTIDIAPQTSSSSEDETKVTELATQFEGASTVVSLVGTLRGDFERIQLRGTRNVARAAKSVGAKHIMISALGADPRSNVPHFRTKGLVEEAVFEAASNSTVIRPSLVFGDGFFTRFAALSSVLPFLPVFGGGQTRFAPVYAGDVGRAVEIACRVDDPDAMEATDGKVIQAGGPDVLTYRELMQLVCRFTGRTRPIISLPFWAGHLQASILERLPLPESSIFSLTRDQIRQLQLDNIESSPLPASHLSLSSLLGHFPRPGYFADPSTSLTPISSIVPGYLSPGGRGAFQEPIKNKRTHGRGNPDMEEMLNEVRGMTEQAKVRRKELDKKEGGGGDDEHRIAL